LHANVLFKAFKAGPAVADTPLAPAGIETTHSREDGVDPAIEAKEMVKFVLDPLTIPSESVNEDCAERQPQATQKTILSTARLEKGKSDLIALNSSTPDRSGFSTCGLRFSLELF
jgi:hypothetical protein